MDMEEMLTSKKLEAAFKMFDKDGSGSISGDELKEALGMIGDDTVDEEI